MKHYVCTFGVKPNFCETFTQTVVISEHPLFVIRRVKIENIYIKYTILFYDEIDSELYFLFKESLNPEKDSGSYLLLKNSDYKK